MPSNPVVNMLRQGSASNPNPFTIAIIANPVLETPWKSGRFAVDPITAHQSEFDKCTNYIVTSLFGGLPGQREILLGDPTVAAEIRVISLFVTGLPTVDANSLIAQDSVSNLLVARRTKFLPLLASYGLAADIAYAVSNSASHTRASAWYTSDDDARGGVPFMLDGVALMHRYWCLILGTVALHCANDSLTAVHEFGHALSSYSNGAITDLYVDSPPALNNKHRPSVSILPASFGVYNTTTIGVDTTRDGIGYPVGWRSYHPELNAPTLPAIMDDYWLAPTSVPGSTPEQCEHDTITRLFLLDRIRAKINR